MKLRITRDYQQARKEAYPPLEQLADALYWQAQGDMKPMQTYLAAVAAVKERIKKPKPVP